MEDQPLYGLSYKSLSTAEIVANLKSSHCLTHKPKRMRLQTRECREVERNEDDPVAVLHVAASPWRTT